MPHSIAPETRFWLKVMRPREAGACWPWLDSLDEAGYLHLGDNKLNMWEMRERGRSATGERHGTRVHPERTPRGERHGMAKLTAAQVRKIRELHTEQRMSGVELAREFGVTPSCVCGILRWRSWRKDI